MQEDRLGIPFVGESGKLLDRILASVQLDRCARVAELQVSRLPCCVVHICEP